MSKKIGLLVVSCIYIFSFTAQAQRPRRGFNRNNAVNTEQHAKQMTERMAFVYDLSDKQKADLLIINQEWAKERQAYRTTRNSNRVRDCRYCCMDCNLQGQRALQRDSIRKENQLARDQSRAAYSEKVKRIFTKKQFEKYTKAEQWKNQSKRQPKR